MFVGEDGKDNGCNAAGGKKEPDQHVAEKLFFMFITHVSLFGLARQGKSNSKIAIC
jgi:hypothetical protein